MTTKAKPAAAHPMQPVIIDEDGVARFHKNVIVRYILERGKEIGVDMNHLALLPFSREDREQFLQLIGYSVSGFGDLSYVSRKSVSRADKAAEKALATGETQC